MTAAIPPMRTNSTFASASNFSRSRVKPIVPDSCFAQLSNGSPHPLVILQTLAQSQSQIGFDETDVHLALVWIAKRWRCLLQVNDDYDLYNDSWADAGTIAFMIRDDDLQQHNFSRCWCVLSSS